MRWSAFVFDPDRLIQNRRALEADLTRKTDGLGGPPLHRAIGVQARSRAETSRAALTGEKPEGSEEIAFAS
jgi:hypothetical protein